MKWLIKGKLKSISISQYRIDWNKKSPSNFAQEIKNWLHDNCSNYIWLEEMRIPGTLLRIDWVCLNKKLCIEADGIQHNKYIKHFFKNRIGYLNSIKRDMKKEELLQINGYKLIRIFPEDLPLNHSFFVDNFDVYL